MVCRKHYQVCSACPLLTTVEPVFNEEGQRILKTAALAHKYPNAKIVLTGGTPDDNPEALSESKVAYNTLEALKVAFPSASSKLPF